MYDNGGKLSFTVIQKVSSKKEALAAEKKAIEEFTAANLCLNPLHDKVDRSILIHQQRNMEQQENVRLKDAWEEKIYSFLVRNRHSEVKITDIASQVFNLPTSALEFRVTLRIADCLRALGWKKKIKKVQKSTTTVYVPPDGFYDGTDSTSMNEDNDEDSLQTVLNRFRYIHQ